MENSYVSVESDCEGRNSVTICNDISSLRDQNSIDKLSDGVVGKLIISDGSTMNDTNSESCSIQKQYIEVYEEEEDDDNISDEDLLAQMGYAESTTKRYREKGHPREHYDAQMEEKEKVDLSEDTTVGKMDDRKQESIHELCTTPVATINLVSALKGSRLRDGNLIKDCRVSWAPDVYDPTPTPPEHFASNTDERQENDRKIKGASLRKKGKGSGKRSASSKDGGREKGAARHKDDKQSNRKHGKKHGGNSSRRRGSDEY